MNVNRKQFLVSVHEREGSEFMCLNFVYVKMIRTGIEVLSALNFTDDSSDGT